MLNSFFSIITKLNNFLIVFAADSNQLINPVIGNLGNDPASANDGSLFINYAVKLWRAAINVGALVVIGYYVIAAYEWLSSGDDTKGVEKAKSRFTHATIGLLLLVASFAIVAFVSNLLFGQDFNLLELTFPTD